MNSGYPEPAEVQLCADCETVKQTGLDYPDHKCPYPVQLWYKFVDQDALAHSVNSPPGTRGKAKGSPPPLSCEPHTSDEPESDTTFTFPLHDDFVITQAAKAANMTVQRNNPLSPCLAPSDDSLLEDSPDLSSGVIDSLQDASGERTDLQISRRHSKRIESAGRPKRGSKLSTTSLRFSHVEIPIKMNRGMFTGERNRQDSLTSTFDHAIGLGPSRSTYPKEHKPTPRDLRAQRRNTLKILKKVTV